MANKYSVKKSDLDQVLKQIDALAQLNKIKAEQEAQKRRELELLERNRWDLGPHQIPPPDNDWLTWLILAGRGVGKTFACAHYVDEYARDNPDARIAIIGINQQEAVDICVNGTSGLRNFNPEIKLRVEVGGTHIRWPNGAQARVFGASTIEEADKLRGLNHSLVWADEIAAWKQFQYTWQMMLMGLRIKISDPNQWPRVVASTTPRKLTFLKKLVEDETTRISRARTEDAKHLDERQKQWLISEYSGTRIGRQELDGEMLDDVEGALWRSDWIDSARIKIRSDEERKKFAESMKRIVVAVDPAVTSKKPTSVELKKMNIGIGNKESGGRESDFTAICVAGLGEDGEFYVLDIKSVQDTPADWGKLVVDTYHEWKADKIIAESNQGGDLIELNIKIVDKSVPVKLIHAYRGKTLRAEPVANLYEKGKVHHVGEFREAEDQMLVFPMEPGAHDDMVDAVVYAVTELNGRGGYGLRFL